MKQAFSIIASLVDESSDSGKEGKGEDTSSTSFFQFQQGNSVTKILVADDIIDPNFSPALIPCPLSNDFEVLPSKGYLILGFMLVTFIGSRTQQQVQCFSSEPSP